MTIKETAEIIITQLVDKPNEVKIEEKDENGEIKLKIHVAQDDIGKVVGKKGQNIGAVRTLLKAIGAKELKKHIIIDINEF